MGTNSLKGIYINTVNNGDVYFSKAKRMEVWLTSTNSMFYFSKADLDDEYRLSLKKDVKLAPIQFVKWSN